MFIKMYILTLLVNHRHMILTFGFNLLHEIFMHFKIFIENQRLIINKKKSPKIFL